MEPFIVTSFSPFNNCVIYLDILFNSSGGNLAPSLGGRKNFSRTKMTFFLKKISILMTTIFDDLFLVIDQVFQISPPFSLIFWIFTLLNIVHNPFLTRKIAYLFLLFSYSAADVKSHQTRTVNFS